MILSHDQTFESYPCRFCNGRMSDPDQLAVHEQRHEIQDMICKGEIKTKWEAMFRFERKKTCTVEGCAEPYFAKGLCRRHYHRKYRQENNDVSIRLKKMRGRAA